MTMPDGAVFADKSIEDRIEIVHKIRIPHPQYNRAIKEIEKCHKYSKLTAEPKSLLIVGEAGAGKSTIFKNYISGQYKEWEKETDEGFIFQKNILSLTLQSPVTIKSVLYNLLVELGDTTANPGSTNHANHFKLVNLIKDCGVEMIMLDEFHNFVDRGKKKVLFGVSEWFKSLINDTKIPVVLFGLLDPNEPQLDSREVLRCNPQLARRIPREIQLERFPFKSASDKKFYKRFLFEVDKKLPFKQFSNLDHDEMCKAFYSATDGLMYNLMTLIREAATYAIEKEEDCITLELLARAFDENDFISTKRDGCKISNPFEELIDIGSEVDIPISS